ncbi:phosphatidylglycerol lysyltransferase domain-containing protein [Spongisporangium articulatum]|uniref:Phosphatidylglycerol lysyltransferase domain-containing protein n=1 Tax=Spongisporangium articulatum TaxID=3362603 RepID=A0ABW8ARR3_9ACTN
MVSQGTAVRTRPAGVALPGLVDRPRSVPSTIAWLVRFSAVLAFLTEAAPGHGVEGGPFDIISDGVGFATAMASAAAMLLLAGGLRRRNRRAWRFALGVVAAGVLAHLQTQRFAVAAVYLVVLVVLVHGRDEFTARSQRRSRLAAIRVFLVMGGGSMVAGLLLASRTAPHSAFGDRVVEVFFGLLGFAPQLRFRDSGLSELTGIALGTLGAFTALFTLAAMLAPVRKPPVRTADDEQRLRDLLARFGQHDSLGYFCLRSDKSVIFSASGKAAVAYRVLGGVSLASGDPIGDYEAWPGAIEAWLAEAELYGWVPGVVGTSEAGALVLKRYGLDALELGDEAVVDLAGFTLEGRAMRGVRQAVNRCVRAGYTCRVDRQKDLAPAVLSELGAAAEAFRGEEVERGFSMALSRLGDVAADPDLALAQVRDADGRLVAVLGFVPWGATGLSLDLMRRARGSENGTVEFAVAQVAEATRGWGVKRISLNFAVFRAVFARGARVGAGPVLRLWHRVLLLVSRWFQVESLYRANAKYHPDWVPRFVSFRRSLDLPRIALAALEAEAFVARPHLPRWLHPQRGR